MVFDDEGSFIVNEETGEMNWLREDQGNYVLDMWIPPSSMMAESPFGWQP